jgi:four helix bundle protein
MADYRKLQVYQKALALSRRVTPLLPRVRRKSRRLEDQLERAVESIANAISEGRGKTTDRDFASYITTAISSANEVEHHLQRALDRDALTEAEHESLAADTIEVRKMLIGFRRTLRGE